MPETTPENSYDVVTVNPRGSRTVYVDALGGHGLAPTLSTVGEARQH